MGECDPKESEWNLDDPVLGHDKIQGGDRDWWLE